MFLLRTLGTVTLVDRGPGGDRRLDLQPKRLALLACLARRAPGTLARREELVAVLWPEADEAHGRGVLRQALTGLRKQLGADAVLTHGDDEVGIDPRVLACDADQFEAACRAGDHAAACELYVGDFLSGFHVSGVSADFEQWADAERSRLHRAAVEAASALADARAEAPDAVRWARRVVELEPLNEPAVGRLMRLLDRRGDRAGALAAYAALERRLREELELAPGAALQAHSRGLRTRAESLPAAADPTERAMPPVSTDEARAAVPVAADVPTRHATAPGAAARRLPSLRLAAVLGAVATLTVVAIIASARPRPVAPTGAPTAIAVLPFRVHASGPDVAGLSEAVADMLTMRLSGGSVIHMVEPGRVLAAWRSAPPGDDERSSRGAQLRFARDLGAGRLVEGSLGGTRERLVATAWMVDPRSGRRAAPATVEGSADELAELVDRLAAGVLRRAVATDAGHLESLEGVPLPALHAFLAGRMAAGRGRRHEAQLRLRESLDADSTFALAGLELSMGSQWATGFTDDNERGIRVAQAHRDRLGAADRTLLDMWLATYHSRREAFAAQDSGVTTYPEWSAMWYLLGDLYYHDGRLAGIEDAHARAERAFRRGWYFDSVAQASALIPLPLVPGPMEHMVELAHQRGDTATVRLLAAIVNATDSASDVARVVNWHLAQVAGPAAQRDYWASLRDATENTTKNITLFIVWSGVGIEDHLVASTEDMRRLEAHDPGYSSFARYVKAFNAGRPGDAPAQPDSGRRWRRELDAIWWDGDTAVAERAARLLEAELVARPVRESPFRVYDACTLGLWQAVRRPQAGTPAAVDLLATGPDGTGDYRELCRAMIAAAVAVGGARSDAMGRTVIADSLARSLNGALCCPARLAQANLMLAAMWERLGDRRRALLALRRRGQPWGIAPLFMSTYLREEGRLAALVGDTAGAVRAYRHYVGMRPNPEPRLRERDEIVRRALSALESGNAGR